jgi:two-component system nitrogen regulation response regulator NtrX
MRDLKELLAALAPIPSPILILGESGSGKELVARQLHLGSGRPPDLFLAVNCAALPETLVESELFGHERGAFTGADRTRKGAFENVAGGTLFLDEIGELTAAAQAKLLRVVEERGVTRLGGKQLLKVDTRVVAATNRNLEAEVAAGRFRQDLLYRLNVHVVRVPPLRERLADVPLLVGHFLDTTCEQFGIRRKEITPEAMALLQRYDWRRNNVRELRNEIERLIIACEGTTIGPDCLPAEIRAATGGADSGRTAPSLAHATAPTGTLKDLKAAAEKQILLTALDRNAWHITRTAAELGLADHASLLKIMRRHGLKRK